jgi:hypothetical protein
MGPKTFQRIVDHVFPTRKAYFDLGISPYNWLEWGYPDYGGLPYSIYKTLSSEAVDAMQDILQDTYKRKRDFAKAYRDRLRELGEPGNYDIK